MAWHLFVFKHNSINLGYQTKKLAFIIQMKFRSTNESYDLKKTEAFLESSKFRIEAKKNLYTLKSKES